MIFDFFKIRHECRHNSVPADIDEAYCPECGELIRNKWFIVRCSCCGIKRIARIKNGEIMPAGKFCTNCGSSEYHVQELEKLNFTDIRYAVFKRFIVKQEKTPEFNQVWTDEADCCKHQSSDNRLEALYLPGS